MSCGLRRTKLGSCALTLTLIYPAILRPHVARRVPQNGDESRVAEYVFDPRSGRFGRLGIVPESRPAHEGASPTFRSEMIDMSVPSRAARYDKLGHKKLLQDLKFHVFGSRNHTMTKRRCEEFFSDDANFVLDGCTVDAV